MRTRRAARTGVAAWSQLCLALLAVSAARGDRIVSPVDQRIGAVREIEGSGTAHARPDAGEGQSLPRVPLSRNDEIANRDRLTTTRDARLTIQLDRGNASVVLLERSSATILDGGADCQIKLTRGKIESRTDCKSVDLFTDVTPSGTHFLFATGPSGSRIEVYSGEVRVESRAGKGRPVMVPWGHFTTVAPGQAPALPLRLGADSRRTPPSAGGHCDPGTSVACLDPEPDPVLPRVDMLRPPR